MSDNDIRDQIIAILTANLGEGVTGFAGDPRYEVDYWPTEIPLIDWLLDGGIPAGESTEIYGDYPTLKSYVALRAIASVQSRGGLAALIDSEHAFDSGWAESLGVVVDDLFVAYPGTAEQAVAATEALISKGFDLIVWDSVAPTLPLTERDESPTNAKQAARLGSVLTEMRSLTEAAGNTALLFINQTQADAATTFDGPVAVPGGQARPLCASQRLRVARVGKSSSDRRARDGEWDVTSWQVDSHKVKVVLEQAKPNMPDRESGLMLDVREVRIHVTASAMGWGWRRAS